MNVVVVYVVGYWAGFDNANVRGDHRTTEATWDEVAVVHASSALAPFTASCHHQLVVVTVKWLGSRFWPFKPDCLPIPAEVSDARLVGRVNHVETKALRLETGDLASKVVGR